MYSYYTGVGSRDTPLEVCNEMSNIAYRLQQLNYTLRSGGAKGADKAFEAGVTEPSMKNIFYANDTICDAAFDLASNIHPAWDRCSPYAKRLHARNVYQVLGKTLDRPSHFLICWTKDGKDVGGTRTAIVLAREWGVPVYNLFDGKPKELMEILNNET